jgi:hypothetical protein
MQAPIGQLGSVEIARKYLLAGNAYTTLVSKKTGTRFTFRIQRGKPKMEGKVTPWFVALLNGPENGSDYTFLGTIFQDGFYKHGGKSRVSPDAASAKAFAWVWARVNGGVGEVLNDVEIWHSGRCGVCGRLLTDPASVTRGIGPKCADGGF